MKNKVTTGTHARSRHEIIAQPGEGIAEQANSVIEIGSDGTAEVRSEDENADRRPGPAVDAEDQDQSEADPSPARQKDRARDEPRTAGTDDAGPEQDTYD